MYFSLSFIPSFATNIIKFLNTHSFDGISSIVLLVLHTKRVKKREEKEGRS